MRFVYLNHVRTIDKHIALVHACWSLHIYLRENFLIITASSFFAFPCITSRYAIPSFRVRNSHHLHYTPRRHDTHHISSRKKKLRNELKIPTQIRQQQQQGNETEYKILIKHITLIYVYRRSAYRYKIYMAAGKKLQIGKWWKGSDNVRRIFAHRMPSDFHPIISFSYFCPELILSLSHFFPLHLPLYPSLCISISLSLSLAIIRSHCTVCFYVQAISSLCSQFPRPFFHGRPVSITSTHFVTGYTISIQARGETLAMLGAPWNCVPTDHCSRSRTPIKHRSSGTVIKINLNSTLSAFLCLGSLSSKMATTTWTANSNHICVLRIYRSNQSATVDIFYLYLSVC